MYLFSWGKEWKGIRKQAGLILSPASSKEKSVAITKGKKFFLSYLKSSNSGLRMT